MSGWHQSSRHERGYGTQWDKLRKHVLRRDDYLCQTCLMSGRVTEAREVDHIIPKSQDGTDDCENLASICTACHRAKTQREARAARGAAPRIEFDPSGFPIWD